MDQQELARRTQTIRDDFFFRKAAGSSSRNPGGGEGNKRKRSESKADGKDAPEKRKHDQHVRTSVARHTAGEIIFPKLQWSDAAQAARTVIANVCRDEGWPMNRSRLEHLTSRDRFTEPARRHRRDDAQQRPLLLRSAPLTLGLGPKNSFAYLWHHQMTEQPKRPATEEDFCRFSDFSRHSHKKPSFEAFFACQPSKFFVAENGIVRWEDARYALEVITGCHSVPMDSASQNLDLSCIVGHRACWKEGSWRMEKSMLVADSEIRAGECIVLKRKPCGAPEQGINPYIPTQFKLIGVEYAKADDQEKLKIIQQQQVHNNGYDERYKERPTIVVGKTAAETLALNFNDVQDSHRALPPSYICHCCGVLGLHRGEECPKRDIPGFIGLNRKKDIHGVLFEELREVTDPEQIGFAPFFRDGRFYTRKTDEERGSIQRRAQPRDGGDHRHDSPRNREGIQGRREPMPKRIKKETV